MTAETLHLFWISAIFVILLASIGLYCIIVSKNLIRILIGLELITKAITLLLIAVGYFTGRIALTQALVITVIVVEVVVIAVAAGIVIGAHEHTDSIDVRNISNLRG